MRMNLDTWLAAERRSLRRVRLLAIGSKYASNKGMPQCKAAVPVRHVNAVIMSFDPNEKQSVICERKL